MQVFKLTIIRVPEAAQGDLIYRTHTVKAQSLAEAEMRCVVEALVSSMDNVVDWYAQAVY